MDKDETAAEERMLSRESERFDAEGEAGTSSGEELDILLDDAFLDRADRERLLVLAALRRSSRR